MTTQTATLAAFILARVEEDEAAAKGAPPGPWYSNPGGYVETDPFGEGTGFNMVASASDLAGRDAADHIARHDPARVLAECEAFKAIVARHTATSDYSEPWDPICSEETHLATPDECDDLRVLAAIWRNHPDYDESWRP